MAKRQAVEGGWHRQSPTPSSRCECDWPGAVHPVTCWRVTMGNLQADTISKNSTSTISNSHKLDGKQRLISIMGCDYCCPPAPAPESDVSPLAAPSKKTTGCHDSCCDSDDAEPLDTKASGQKEPTAEKPDDCCSPSKCADNRTENHTDTPDCCRGKVSPCCDTSCLDLLAMRECETSGTAGPGPNSQPNSE